MKNTTMNDYLPDDPRGTNESQRSAKVIKFVRYVQRREISKISYFISFGADPRSNQWNWKSKTCWSRSSINYQGQWSPLKRHVVIIGTVIHCTMTSRHCFPNILNIERSMIERRILALTTEITPEVTVDTIHTKQYRERRSLHWIGRDSPRNDDDNTVLCNVGHTIMVLLATLWCSEQQQPTAFLYFSMVCVLLMRLSFKKDTHRVCNSGLRLNTHHLWPELILLVEFRV